MSITLVEFDRAIFDTEKCSLNMNFTTVNNQLVTTVFNVSEGIHDDDYYRDRLRQSLLYKAHLSVEEYRQLLWIQIQENLSDYKADPVCFMNSQQNRRNFEFKVLMHLVENYKLASRVKLVYINNRPQAELIARCLQYLLTVV